MSEINGHVRAGGTAPLEPRRASLGATLYTRAFYDPAPCPEGLAKGEES